MTYPERPQNRSAARVAVLALLVFSAAISAPISLGALAQDGTAQVAGEPVADTGGATASLTLAGQMVRRTQDWLIREGPRFVFEIGAAVVIFLLFVLLARIVGRVTRKALDSEHAEFSQLLEDFVVSFVVKAVLVLGLLVSLTQMGIDLAPLLAGIGVAGFIVGFAIKDSLSNFAAGLMILAYRPYDVGDSIEAAGVTGKVSNMSLASTTVTTFDNQRLMVPNSKIWGGVIRNASAEPTRRVDMTFGIGYDDDMDQAESLLREIVVGHELVLADPEPLIRLHELADSSVNFIVRPWVQNADYGTVLGDVTREVKRRFDAEGLSIPYPQRDVHLHQAA